MAIVPQEIYDFLYSISLELFFAACFAIAFALLQVVKMPKQLKSVSKVRQDFKGVLAEATSGNATKVVAAWRAAKTKQAASDQTLKAVTQALLETEPASLTSEIFEHFSAHASKLVTHDSKAIMAVLEAVAQSGNCEIMESTFQMFVQRLRISPKACMQEVLLGGYAMAGDEKKTAKLVAKLREANQKVTVRGYSLMMKGFLKNGMIDATVDQIKAMHSQGLSVPSLAVSELFRTAQEANRMAEVFSSVSSAVPLMNNAINVVLDYCLKSQDVELVETVEKYLRDSNHQLIFPIYEGLIKVYTSAGSPHANELFQEMKTACTHISDGLCINLLSRCSEAKAVVFAEEVMAYLRSHSKASLSAYVGLMRVYAACSRYSEACDLYDQLRADGIEPDSMMYGCLMKFSAECGRTDLTRELISKVEGFDIHHHMALIRAAGQDKDVDMAFSILEKVRGATQQLDIMVYNAVLDVCSSNGEMKRARDLAAEMRQDGMIDIISYNTLLKGYSVCGDSRGAKELFAEMEKGGFTPNDISYNCLINLAASSGDFNTAWQTIETMERKGFPIDCYTVSTMMKSLKQGRTSRDAVAKVMSLLDRHGIDVCSEEVLLNTALEACIKNFEQKRIERLLAHVDSKRAGMNLAPHTYATLIRAYSLLKRLNRCRELWMEMTQHRNLTPSNVALGCMLDALVCNGSVTDALTLFRKWQHQVEPSTVIYSTIIKGFANCRDNKSAAEIWKEFRAKGLPLNSMVFNAIIDAHARVGAMDEVASLVDSMDASGVKPDDITKSMVAKGYCTNGQLDKAMDVFRSLTGPANGNTVVVFNTILDGCVRHERMDIADMLLKSMESWGIIPSNFTLGIIVKMWGIRHQLDKALTAVETMPRKYSFTANVPVMSCLLFACLRNNALNDAFNAYEAIRAMSTTVETKIFNALINNCTRLNKGEKAVALVEEAYGLAPGSKRLIAGEDLDSRCMDNIMRLLYKQGLSDKLGAPLLQKMKSAKVPVSPRLMSMVMGGQEQAARPWK
jgi:pentatricopeptide repeat protein